MRKKLRKTLRGATLQEFVMVPITDPAEQAALDRRCREAEEVFAVGRSNSAKPKSRKKGNGQHTHEKGI